MTNLTPDTIRETILEHIKTGKAHMRPRWHFVLKTTLAIIGGILVGLLAVYLVSLAFFVFHKTGMNFLSDFGSPGLLRLLISLPWLFILAGLVFVVVLELLVRHYAFAYRKPLLYSLIGVTGVVVLGTVIVASTPLHEGLLIRARTGRLPVAGALYRGYELQRSQHVHVGAITRVIEEGFHMEDPRGERLIIIVGPRTSFPRGRDLQTGDRVFVFGEREEDIVRALGIRRTDDGPRRIPMIP